MTNTPIIDDAIRAGCKALDGTIGIADECNHPSCRCVKKTLIIAALRAALPWDLPAERLEAMALAMVVRTAAHFGDDPPVNPDLRVTIVLVLAAYRANPIMRELYPERFR